MEPLGLSAYRAAKGLGVAPITLSLILRGKRAISPAFALRLSKYFGVDADFWLALQNHADLTAAAEMPAKLEAIQPCAALGKRRFLIKESRSGGQRGWQVVLLDPERKTMRR